jgi:hypothetical protein
VPRGSRTGGSTGIPADVYWSNEANREVLEIENQYKEGLITDGERYNKVVDIWAQVTENIGFEILDELGSVMITDPSGKKKRVPSFNPIFMMADSGARGSAQQIRQLAGMRGLMAKPMLVVMPLGYGAPEIVSRQTTGIRDPNLRDRNMQKFREALLGEHFTYAHAMGVLAATVLLVDALVIAVGPEAKGVSFRKRTR